MSIRTVKPSQENSAPILLPFLKWAGGKRWLTNQYSSLFPRKFNRYIEPFLGGGAVFFHLQPANAILSDRNSDLINAYTQLRDNWKSVHRTLRRHQKCHSKEYFYEERSRRHRVAHEKAAQFIYLNRTCWNGLYRVNLQGVFNVPMGTKTAVLLDTDDFEETARLLRSSDVNVADFEQTLDEAQFDDFVFIDPPYVTRHNFNGFIKYNDHLFSWRDQERLFSAIDKAAKRGAMILLTNAAHSSVRELYRGVGKHFDLNRASVLAADPSNRGTTTEMAIAINYQAGVS